MDLQHQAMEKSVQKRCTHIFRKPLENTLARPRNENNQLRFAPLRRDIMITLFGGGIYPLRNMPIIRTSVAALQSLFSEWIIHKTDTQLA